MKSFLFLLTCLLILHWTLALPGEKSAQKSDTKEPQHEDESSHHQGVHLYSWRWNETFYSEYSKFSRPVMISLLVVFAVIFKIIFHHLTFLERLLPESCVLILVGILFGLLITTALDGTNNPFPKFNANLFFHILLPPIIFDSAISLYNKEFFATFYSVVIFAVFGTLFNVFTIGPSLYGLSKSGILGEFDYNQTTTNELGMLPCLTFGSLISAVDPVAVLAIFEQIGVNAGLYFLVFGESLFNDGVTVVLYNSMNTLAELPSVRGHDVLMAILSFFTVVFGGAIIGGVHAFFASVMTRFTKHVRVVEPLVILTTAYSAFLWAELFHWSGIISVIAYGVTAKHYAFQNLSQKSFTTVKYAVKTMAATSDCVIFLFLGVSIFTEKQYFHPGFIIATILLCLIFRLCSTFIFSAVVNIRRMEKISVKEQLIMTWGGLRGAVGFSLAMVLKEHLWYRELFLTTALVMVLFTVFLQGGTIKLLVKLLKIDLQESPDALIGIEVQNKVMENITQGMNSICGNMETRGKLRQHLKNLDTIIKDKLIHDESKDQLQRRFEKITVEDHFTNLYAPRLIVGTQVSVDETDVEDDEATTVKIFRKGMKNSNWNKLRTQSVEESGSRRARTMLAALERRNRTAKDMGMEVLHTPLHTRTHSMIMEPETMTGMELNPESPQSLGVNDDVIRRLKAQYEAVQSKRKGADHKTNQANP